MWIAARKQGCFQIVRAKLKGQRASVKGLPLTSSYNLSIKKRIIVSVNWNKLSVGKLCSHNDKLALNVTQKKYDSQETSSCGACCPAPPVPCCYLCCFRFVFCLHKEDGWELSGQLRHRPKSTQRRVTGLNDTPGLPKSWGHRGGQLGGGAETLWQSRAWDEGHIMESP